MMINTGLYTDLSAASLKIQRSLTVVPTSAKDEAFADFTFSEKIRTGAPINIFFTSETDVGLTTNNVTISQQLYNIKDTFGLNLSQLSKILNVSRPQLYKWLEGKVTPQSESFNQRISDMHSLLELIPPEHGPYFGKLANRYISTKDTVFDVLSSPELDKGKLLSAYSSIKNDIEAIENRKNKERKKIPPASGLDVILPSK